MRRTFAFADVSVLAGVDLLSAPMWGVAALWWVLGVSLVILGMIQILRTARTSASPRGPRPDLREVSQSPLDPA